MKKWPEKILITSEVGFNKFKSDAERFFDKTWTRGEIKTPAKFPCIAAIHEYNYTNYGKTMEDINCINIVYVYLDDFK